MKKTSQARDKTVTFNDKPTVVQIANPSHDELQLLAYSPANHPEVKGSASDITIAYPSDIDLFQKIVIDKNGKSVNEINKQLARGFKRLSTSFPSSMFYWQEMKGGMKDGEKIRWSREEVKKMKHKSGLKLHEIFNNPDDIVKLDTLKWDPKQKRFIETTIVFDPRYKNGKPIHAKEKSNYVQDIENEIESLRKEGKKYKMLKRRYLLADEDEKELYKNLFNSPVGALNQLIADIEAKNWVKEHATNKRDKNRVAKAEAEIKRKLKTLNLETDDIEELSKHREELVDDWIYTFD